MSWHSLFSYSIARLISRLVKRYRNSRRPKPCCHGLIGPWGGVIRKRMNVLQSPPHVFSTGQPVARLNIAVNLVFKLPRRAE
jgi:hypothetical protein